MQLVCLTMLVALLLAARAQEAPRPGTAETITARTTDWTRSTWGTHTPRALWDGRRAYAEALIGMNIKNEVACIYSRGPSGWSAAAHISPTYQPPTLLLDAQRYIHAFTTTGGIIGHHWRSVRPRDVSRFEEVPLPEPEKFGYGYLGVGTDGKRLVLVGSEKDTWTSYLTLQPSPAEPWTKPVALQPKVQDAHGEVIALYPTVIVAGDLIHVIYIDYRLGKTYSGSRYVCFDMRKHAVVERHTIVSAPVAEYTAKCDALLGRDGKLRVLYTGGEVAVSGEKIEPGIETRNGFFLATRQGPGQWEVRKVGPSAGQFGQLFERTDGRLYVVQSPWDGGVAKLLQSDDGGRSWASAEGPTWPTPGEGPCVIKANSGSVMDDTLRAVQSPKDASAPKGTSPYGLEFIQLDLGKH
jgi:hypothetical protein